MNWRLAIIAGWGGPSLFATPRRSIPDIDELFFDMIDRKGDRPADHVLRLPPVKRGRFKPSQRAQQRRR